jgi:peptidoglycan hydrolase CwlO-like protein
MKDPTIPPADTRKKLMFYDTEENLAKLKIRCQFDGFSQSQFFRVMLEGYINNDESVLEYIRKSKEKYNIQGQQKRNKIDSILRKKDETEKKFALKNEEIENIFDMIESETNI